MMKIELQFSILARENLQTQADLQFHAELGLYDMTSLVLMISELLVPFHYWRHRTFLFESLSSLNPQLRQLKVTDFV